MRGYAVTVVNLHARSGITGYGRTRNEAFKRALVLAGEPWLREGGDKLTMLRTLWTGLMADDRTSPHAYASNPHGAGVEWRKLS